MSIAYVSSASTESNAAASLSVTKPSGTVEGDVLIVLVWKPDADADISSSGFTRVNLPMTSGSTATALLWKAAGPSEPASYTVVGGPVGTSDTPLDVIVATYRGLETSGPVGANTTDVEGVFGGAVIPNVTLTANSPRLLTWACLDNFTGIGIDADDPPWTNRESTALRSQRTTGYADYQYVGLAGNTTTGLDEWTSGAEGTARLATIELVPGNEPPSAPALTFPVSETVNLAQTIRFDWDFSDNDPDDAQSQFQLQVRPQLSTTNTVDVTSETVSTFYDLAGSTLSADGYEWRVRTWDSVGEVGPYTSWTPFTAAAAPTGPSITDPVAGQTIATETYTVQWSASEQDAYQLRKVADSAGSPDTGTVYFDTGTVTSSTTRQLAVTFDTNNRTEHVQVRVQRNALWSDWTSVSVDVSYTPPATPTLTVNDTTTAGAVTLQAAHPTPGASEPTVETVDMERRITGTSDTLRIAAGLAPTAVFVDWTVASGVAYEYRPRAYGDNGTSTYGAWTA